MKKYSGSLALCWGLILVGLMVTAQPLIVVGGSASKPVFEEAARMFEREENASITLLLGGSGELLSRIRLTGIGDVYLPGSHDFMQQAVHFGLIATGSERALAYLIPAICVPSGNPKNISCLEDLALPGVRVGIGHPDMVCVGLYAVEILEKAGLAKSVKANIVAYLESCAKAATAVALGSVDAVMGWREFGSWSPKGIKVISLPPERISRIATLPGGVLITAGNAGLAKKFLEFLASPKGKAVYQKWGYMTDEADVRKLAPSAVIGGLYALPDDWK